MSSMLKMSDSAVLAIHTMALLAKFPNRKFTTADVVKIYGCSQNTLSKAMQRLVRAGLVQSQRGPTGGFHVSKDPQEITLLHIYEAIDGRMGCDGCMLSHGDCPMGCCLLGGVVASVNDAVRESFEKITLDRLAESMTIEVESKDGSP